MGTVCKEPITASLDVALIRFDNVPWKHYLPAVEPLLPEDGKENEVDPTESLKNASQLAGLLLLAVPLLLPCRARLTVKPKNMFAEKRNTLLRSSTEKRETRKISLTRAGSVQRAVENWNKTKPEQDPSRDFHEFKRDRSSGSLKKDGISANANRWSFHGRSTAEDSNSPSASHSVNTDDYEIIEMKGGSLQPKEVIDLSVIDETESIPERGLVFRMTRKVFNTLVCVLVSAIIILIVTVVSVHFILF